MSKEKNTAPLTEQELRRKRLTDLYEFAEMLVLAAAAILILFALLARISVVEGGSMESTLLENDRVVISDLLYSPKCGDIVVLHAKDLDGGIPIIKRVIAVGGDELDIDFETWEVRVNGVLLSEPYLDRGSGSMTTQSVEHLTFPMTIPEGFLFVMGDNRQGSMDSRSEGIGLIDQRYVVGRVWSRILPTDSATFF